MMGLAQFTSYDRDTGCILGTHVGTIDNILRDYQAMGDVGVIEGTFDSSLYCVSSSGDVKHRPSLKLPGTTSLGINKALTIKGLPSGTTVNWMEKINGVKNYHTETFVDGGDFSYTPNIECLLCIDFVVPWPWQEQKMIIQVIEA